MLACNHIHNGALTTLRILYMYRVNMDLVFIGAYFLNCCDCFWFVLFDQHHAFCIRKELKHDLQPPNDLVSIVSHQLIITGNIGLALSTVGNHIFDRCRILRCQLYMSWKSCSAKSYDACCFDFFQNLLCGQSGRVHFCSYAFRQRILPVVHNHDGKICRTKHILPFLDCLYGSGNRTDNVS